MASLQHVRENRFNWYVRLATTLVAISVLGVTAASASGFADINCSIPARIAYQIAAAAISLPYLVYLLLTTGPMARKSNLWNYWAQFACDLLFVALWIAAAALSTPECNDLCNVCFNGAPSADALFADAYVYEGNVLCYCAVPTYGYSSYGGYSSSAKRAVGNVLRRELNSIGKSVFAGLQKRSTATRVGQEAAQVQSRQGLDGVMIFFFVLAILVAAVVRRRAVSAATTSHEAHAEPIEVQQQHTQAQDVEHKNEVDVAGNIVENI